MMGLQLIFFLIGFALLHMGHIRNGGVHFCFAVRLDGGVGDIFAVAGSDLAGGQGVLLAIIPVTAGCVTHRRVPVIQAVFRLGKVAVILHDCTAVPPRPLGPPGN